MPKLIDGQTITSYAIFRIGLKKKLRDIDANVFEKLPIIKEKMEHSRNTYRLLVQLYMPCRMA